MSIRTLRPNHGMGYRLLPAMLSSPPLVDGSRRLAAAIFDTASSLRAGATDPSSPGRQRLSPGLAAIDLACLR